MEKQVQVNGLWISYQATRLGRLAPDHDDTAQAQMQDVRHTHVVGPVSQLTQAQGSYLYLRYPNPGLL